MFIYVVIEMLFFLKFVGGQPFTYYVDCDGGSDTNGGKAQNDAWKTFNEVNKWRKFSQGDTVLFKRGCVWNQQMKVESQGTSANWITYSDYGTGELPTIDSSEDLSQATWTLCTSCSGISDVYYHQFSGSKDIQQVFVDGIAYNISHHKENPFHDYYYINSDSSSRTISVGNEFNDGVLKTHSSSEIVGAQVIVRVVHWSFHSSTIQSYDTSGSGSITLVDDSGYDFDTNYGFFIMNKLWMMKPGTYFHDSGANRLYLKLSDSSDPSSNHDIRIATSEFNVRFYEAQYVTFENIRVKYSIDDGMWLGNSNNVVIQNCEVDHALKYGIHLSGGTITKVTVQNNLVVNPLWGGIEVYGGSSHLDAYENTIRRNTIEGIGDKGACLRSILSSGTHDNLYVGLSIHGHHNHVIENTLSQSAKCGISVGGNAHKIRGNLIKDIGTVLDDCGMIYMYKGGNHEVVGNLGINAIGNIEGTKHKFTDPTYLPIQGVYCDDVSKNILIEHNTMMYTDYGYQIHDSQADTVRFNLAFGSRKEAINVNEDHILFQHGEGAGFSRDHVITNNIFVSHSETDPIFYLGGELGWMDQLQTLDNNQYFGYNENLKFQRRSDSSNEEFTSLSQWSSTTGYDTNSQIVGEPWYEVNTDGYYYTTGNMIINGRFDEDTQEWTHYPVGDFVQTWDSKYGGSIKSEYQSTIASDKLPLISDTSFQTEKDKKYLLEFEAILNKDDSFDACFRRNESPFNTLVSSSCSATAGDIYNGKVFYDATEDVPNTRVDFYSGSSANIYHYDNITVHEISYFVYEGRNFDFTVLVNEDVNPTTLDLTGSKKYCDINNQIVQGDVTLEARRSLFLINCFCNSDFKCNNRESKKTCPVDCGVCIGGGCGEEEKKKKNDSLLLWVVIGSSSVLLIVVIFCILFVGVFVVVVLFCVIYRLRNKAFQRKSWRNTKREFELLKNQF